VEAHSACWCLEISKNVVPFRRIIGKKDCVISVVDVGEIEVANVNSKTTRTVSHEPINCTAKKAQEQVYNLDGLLMLCKTRLTYPEECEPELLFLCASHV